MNDESSIKSLALLGEIVREDVIQGTILPVDPPTGFETSLLGFVGDTSLLLTCQDMPFTVSLLKGYHCFFGNLSHWFSNFWPCWLDELWGWLCGKHPD